MEMNPMLMNSMEMDLMESIRLETKSGRILPLTCLTKYDVT